MAKLSIHLFPKEPLDDFIHLWFGRFIVELKKAAPNFHDYFFVRSLEGGPHLRLRIDGEPSFFEKTVTPLVVQIFEKEAQAELAVEPFQPEIERFGGAEPYFQAEIYFRVSSQIVLARLLQPNYSYDEKLGDALRFHICTIAAAGFERKTAASFFKKLQTDWVVPFFSPEKPLEAHETAAYFSEIERMFQTSFEKQEAQLRRLVELFWNEFSENLTASQPPDEWTNWIEFNRFSLPKIPEKAWPDLIHLTNNRLGVTNQDEVFINFILANALDTNT